MQLSFYVVEFINLVHSLIDLVATILSFTSKNVQIHIIRLLKVGFPGRLLVSYSFYEYDKIARCSKVLAHMFRGKGIVGIGYVSSKCININLLTTVELKCFFQSVLFLSTCSKQTPSCYQKLNVRVLRISFPLCYSDLEELFNNRLHFVSQMIKITVNVVGL